QALLGRNPEPAGLTFWTNQLAQGVSRFQVAFDMQKSPEFLRNVVLNLYGRFLKRQAEPIGLAFWGAQLEACTSIDQVAAGILSSPEFFPTQGGGTNAGFLNALYVNVLGRPIEPAALTLDSALLASGAYSRYQIAFFVITSTEADNVVVQDFYMMFLHRPADQP